MIFFVILNGKTYNIYEIKNHCTLQSIWKRVPITKQQPFAMFFMNKYFIALDVCTVNCREKSS